MKLSVSLPDQDVEFLDSYAQGHALTRSAVLHEAVQALRRLDLGAEYAAAYAEWETSGEAQLWEATVADGLDAA